MLPHESIRSGFVKSRYLSTRWQIHPPLGLAWTDVAMLVLNGLGDRKVKRYRPRCRKCGSDGIWSFTGPLPRLHGPRRATSAELRMKKIFHQILQNPSVGQAELAL